MTFEILPVPSLATCPRGIRPRWAGDVELRAVLRVERRGVGAQKRGKIAPHVNDYACHRQARVARHRRNVDSGQVRIDPDRILDHEVDRHVWDEGRRRG